MKKLAIISLVTSIICGLKVVMSVVNVLNYIENDILFVIYYVGEGVAWGALSVFFSAYFNKTLRSIASRDRAKSSRH